MTRIDFKLPSYCHLLFLSCPGSHWLQLPGSAHLWDPSACGHTPYRRNYYTVLAQNLGGSFALEFKSLFEL